MLTGNLRANRRYHTLLAFLLLFGFGLRVAWCLMQPGGDAAIDRLPDQREYLELAKSLLSGQGLVLYDPRFTDAVFAFRTPGYPAFVAAMGARLRIVQIAQATLDGSTVLAVYWLAQALLITPAPSRPRRAALMAAGLVAVNPFLIYFSALVLSETLFTAMLAWGMLLLVVGGRGARLGLPGGRWGGWPDGPSPQRGEDTRPPRPWLGTILWLAGGLLLALSGLVRPSAVPLAVSLGIAAAFVNRTSLSNRTGTAAYDGYPDGPPPPPVRMKWPLPVGSTMLLLTVLVLLPWGLRNHRVLGEWVWTTTNEGVTLYDGFNPDADGSSDQSFIRNLPQLRKMGEVARSQYLAVQARRYIREHPKRAIQLAVLKAGRTWSPVPLSREYASRRNVVVGLLYAAPFDLLVLAGLWGGGLRRSAKVFLLLPAIYFTAVHALTVGSLRYRIPVEPPMAVIAASVLVRAAPQWKRAAGGESGGVVE